MCKLVIKIRGKGKFHVLQVINLKVGPTPMGVRYGLVLINGGAVLLTKLNF